MGADPDAVAEAEADRGEGRAARLRRLGGRRARRARPALRAAEVEGALAVLRGRPAPRGCRGNSRRSC
eukprot:14880556-Alexandrium_andersonii.AAC.1